MICCFFFFNDTATTEIYTLSLHDALPICFLLRILQGLGRGLAAVEGGLHGVVEHLGHALVLMRDQGAQRRRADRKSTRLNSSHSQISYAVFCLKKKK